MKHLTRLLSNKTVIIVIFSLITVVIGTHQLILGKKAPDAEGHVYTYYNNYVIFKQSFYHLLENKNPYVLYLNDYWDYYKYSPSFAMFFGIFAVFPDYIGLNLWNLLNTLVLVLAVYYLPGIDNRKKAFILLACLVELVTNLQNSQSNALVAGLMVMALGSLERKNEMAAALFLVLSAYIKLFGIVGFALFLLYPRIWKSVLCTLLWVLILGFVPLIMVGFDSLGTLYSSWFQLLKMDHSASYGISVAGMLHAWTGADLSKTIVLITGAVLFMIPFLRKDLFISYSYHLLILSSLLIWVVIFNHKAESPTYIIAFMGVSIWFFTSGKSKTNIALFAFAFIFTCLSPTDLIPRSLKITFFEPYVLKALPCIVIWIKILSDLLFTGREARDAVDETLKNGSLPVAEN
jgi:hypothetical protein